MTLPGWYDTPRQSGDLFSDRQIEGALAPALSGILDLWAWNDRAVSMLGMELVGPGPNAMDDWHLSATLV
jgi:hypothetical protein